MIKDTIKFSVKLFFVNLAVSFLGIITLSLLLSAQVGFAICAVAGFIFIGFTLGVVWDNSSRKGADDCKATLNYLKRGDGNAVRMIPNAFLRLKALFRDFLPCCPILRYG